VKADKYLSGDRIIRNVFLAPEGKDWPIAVSPKNIMIAVAGGETANHGYWLRVGCCPFAPASAEIKLPANFDRLLSKAEEALGPVPRISPK